MRNRVEEKRILLRILDAIAPGNRYTDYGRVFRSSLSMACALIREERRLWEDQSREEERERLRLTKELKRAREAER